MKLKHALGADDPSARLQAALTAGTGPDPAFIEVLIAQCAVESDFYVRDMLTWALIHHDHAEVIKLLRLELQSETPQARSQALHTLTKIGDPSTWSAITTEMLLDADAEVARTAWRAAAGLVPSGDEVALAKTLSTQFGRGGRDMQLSLSRAFSEIGEIAMTVVEHSSTHEVEAARVHALATALIMTNPEEGFDAAMYEARKTAALLAAHKPQSIDNAH